MNALTSMFMNFNFKFHLDFSCIGVYNLDIEKNETSWQAQIIIFLK